MGTMNVESRSESA